MPQLEFYESQMLNQTCLNIEPKGGALPIRTFPDAAQGRNQRRSVKFHHGFHGWAQMEWGFIRD